MGAEAMWDLRLPKPPNGIISTRRSYTAGSPVFGLLKKGGIADILFVITCRARTADWPM